MLHQLRNKQYQASFAKPMIEDRRFEDAALKIRGSIEDLVSVLVGVLRRMVIVSIVELIQSQLEAY